MPTNAPQTLEAFVDKLIDEKGLSSMADDVLKQMKEDLLSRVEDRVNAEMLETLPADRVESFEALLNEESSSGDDVAAFLKEYVPNFDEVLANALMGFRHTYLNLG
ncbi:hypothetical protein A3C17_00810 [Candidatus Uhrbacteria bacterium RIFCSPHIGHO2_02_FULL_53_13]|uniref:Uncharacterized protein n=1 Tax=Candidatus Uhrbacteria bacterium RIFCSPHIGHO2_02_FULL_53_13 TaxID=1802389 RepID=A0A1F7TXI5_9BACT|nr:MAG: hypothetical protein A3C17_00810 [Candidatus Uhrbacteria bacterium RIFCSPHIGHO2_02_FULL_53_13]